MDSIEREVQEDQKSRTSLILTGTWKKEEFNCSMTIYKQTKKLSQIVRTSVCIGCGVCVSLDKTGNSYMIDTKYGPKPVFHEASDFYYDPVDFCPGYGLNYPSLYRKLFGTYPENWLIGHIESVFVGYSGDNNIRKNSASGGIITSTLIYLLQTGKIDGAIIVEQGIPEPEKARVIIATTEEEIINSAQSVYIPVSNLDILPQLVKNKKYAITCLPDQSSVIRKLQIAGFEPALSIKFIIGPYTGTSLIPDSISYFIKANRIKKSDKITSLKWRAGDWPGYLEIKTQSGRVIKSKKIYYNFLIPFYVTQNSLQSMDFCNEFADLAVGDAWSPQYESIGKGYSVVVSRNQVMTDILNSMNKSGVVILEKKGMEQASEMHGHMIDFKKRGSFLRNSIRKRMGLISSDFGYRPQKISLSRIFIEIVISSIFLLARNNLSRFILTLIPEKVMGPLFNYLRLSWKRISKPAKRKGLKNFEVKITQR